jgi:hypothetical protein
VADHTAGQAASVPIAPLHFLLLAPEGRASLGRRPEALDVREQLAVPDVPGASEAQAVSASPEESGASAGLAVPASQVASAVSAVSAVSAELAELAELVESAASAAPAVLAPASYQQGAKATGTTSAMAIG